jgi:hypothetical protein
VAALSVSGPAFRLGPESLAELGRLCASSAGSVSAGSVSPGSVSAGSVSPGSVSPGDNASLEPGPPRSVPQQRNWAPS